MAVVDGKDNQFQLCFSDPNQGAASANYIAGKGLATKVAVIWKNDDVYSKGIYETFMAAVPELGIEVVSDTTFADGNNADSTDPRTVAFVEKYQERFGEIPN